MSSVRSSSLLVLLSLAACGPKPPPKALPNNLPPPEYEPARGYDLNGTKAAAPAPSAAPAPPPAAAPPAPTAAPPVPSAAPAPQETFTVRYGGKTVLYYEGSHGNQVEYYDASGGAYLWYPGNRGFVVGKWRADGSGVCFQYGGNTFNPVTGERGGAWSCSSLADASRSVVDAVPGDFFRLATGRIPYRLPAKPPFDAVSKVRAAP